MFPPDIHDLARKLVESCAAQKRLIATAESCTGGLIAGAITEIPGASDIFERGLITYGNLAKSEMLGVPAALIERHGAVSAEVAEAMAQGAIQKSRADIAVSATGIAGPGGGSTEKPVGLVFFGIAARAGAAFHQRVQFKGGRDEVRLQSVKEALRLLLAAIED